MNLRETQALMWRAITWPKGVQDFLAQADEATREAFARTFADTQSFARAERVDVYADGYFWRLFEVALDLYPVTCALAGTSRFHNLVTDFVLACPSKTPDVRRFALPLAEFARGHAIASEIEGLAAVASIDAAIAGAIDLPDEPRLSATDLQAIPAEAWPQTRFGLTHTLSLHDTSLDYSALRRTLDRDEPLPQPLPAHDPPRTVVVWRQADHDVYQRTLEIAEARSLRMLHEGGTFAQACDAAAGPTAQAASAADVVGWLQRWLHDDLLVALQTGPHVR